MPSRTHVRLSLVIGCALASPLSASAQGARILRPQSVADSARTLQVKPTLAGFRIGEPTTVALKRLGTALKVDTIGSGMVSYTNLESGINLIATDAEGVGIILLTRREAGALDSIRIGDSRETVLARWGPAAAGGAPSGLWLAGEYIIAVKFDESGHVIQLGMGLAL